jgi:DNA-directed RNA polymerase subunit omega
MWPLARTVMDHYFATLGPDAPIKAEKAVSPEDLKEDLIHSLQAHVDVDEPESEAAPALPSARPVNVFASDDQSSDAKIDRISEDELLEGLARSIPPEAAIGGRAKSHRLVMEE